MDQRWIVDRDSGRHPQLEDISPDGTGPVTHHDEFDRVAWYANYGWAVTQAAGVRARFARWLLRWVL